MSKVDLKFEGGSLLAGIDSDQDGENSLSLAVNLGEVFQEAVAKGEAKVDVKVLSVNFVGTKLFLKLDTDRDGEEVLSLEIDLAEVYSEVAK